MTTAVAKASRRRQRESTTVKKGGRWPASIVWLYGEFRTIGICNSGFLGFLARRILVYLGPFTPCIEKFRYYWAITLPLSFSLGGVY